ncbi:MAG: peptide MFS transporter [Flavobacteriales bacterium]|nr:peptide MFS transporter [Flavobacteriales bacterium]
MSAPKSGHPKGLYFLFFTEMWERFSYYGMRAIFILFMTKILLINDQEASQIYGSYTGLVYLTPLLGGYLCDKFLGNRRSIVIGGLLMALGQFFMFLSASAGSDGIALMWMGLTALIIGNGFFKPNISTMVGQLYPKDDRRIDSAFTIFYMGINIGAFFSPLVCSSFSEYKWGFLAACIGMLIGLVTFVLYQKKYLISEEGNEIGLSVKKMDLQSILLTVGSIAIVFFMLNFKQWFNSDTDIISYFIYGSMIAVPALILSDKSLTKAEMNRIIVIFVLAFFVIFFWGAFEQAGASLTLFADRQTDRTIGDWTMPAEYFQAINPLAVISLAPLFTILWGVLHKRGKEPSSPTKMAWGLALIAVGYAVIAIAVKGLGMGEKVSMWWLVGLYVIHTMGELCLSPIGLSMVSKLAPLRLSSLLMGTWFLANAAANKFAGTLSSLIPPTNVDASAVTEYPSFLGMEITNLYQFFMLFIIMTGTAAGILFFLSRWLQKMMNTAETAPNS